MKSDIASMKSDIASIKAEQAEMKSDIASIRAEQAEMKSDIASIKAEQAHLRNTMQEGFVTLTTRWEITNEDLTTLRANHKRLKRQIDEFVPRTS